VRRKAASAPARPMCARVRVRTRVCRWILTPDSWTTRRQRARLYRCKENEIPDRRESASRITGSTSLSRSRDTSALLPRRDIICLPFWTALSIRKKEERQGLAVPSKRRRGKSAAFASPLSFDARATRVARTLGAFHSAVASWPIVTGRNPVTPRWIVASSLDVR